MDPYYLNISLLAKLILAYLLAALVVRTRPMADDLPQCLWVLLRNGCLIQTYRDKRSSVLHADHLNNPVSISLIM
jgi:hypothetical protein